MRPNQGYAPQDSIYPLRGVNYLDPSTLGDPRLSPEIENISIIKGRARKRFGYSKLGDHNPSDGDFFPCGSPVMALLELETIAGARHLVAVTQKRQYRYDASGGEWVDITPLDGGAPQEWTGGEDNQVHWVVVTDENSRRAIITNGVDTPREWTGSGTFEDVVWNIDNFVTCNTLAVYFDRLVLGGVETTDFAPAVIQWSVVGNFNEWQGEGSGAALLADVQGEIQRLFVLGDRLMIYTDDSIASATLMGGSIIFALETLVHGTGLLSGKSIVSLGPFHLFASQENIYLFDGTRMIRPIGDRISLRYREEIALDNTRQAFAFHDVVKRQVWWFIPSGPTGEKIVYLLEYDVFDPSDLIWTRFILSHPMSAMGVFKRFESLLWNSSELEGVEWRELSIAWNQGSTRADFPTMVIGGDAEVFTYDFFRARDAGISIPARWDSIDFNVPEVYLSERARWLEVELELRGTEVEVLMSTDLGSSFTKLKDVELTTSWQRYQVLVDVNSPTFRVSLRNAMERGWFEMRWLRAWFRPAGSR